MTRAAGPGSGPPWADPSSAGSLLGFLRGNNRDGLQSRAERSRFAWAAAARHSRWLVKRIGRLGHYRVKHLSFNGRNADRDCLFSALGQMKQLRIGGGDHAESVWHRISG